MRQNARPSKDLRPVETLKMYVRKKPPNFTKLCLKSHHFYYRWKDPPTFYRQQGPPAAPINTYINTYIRQGSEKGLSIGQSRSSIEQWRNNGSTRPSPLRVNCGMTVPDAAAEAFKS